MPPTPFVHLLCLFPRIAICDRRVLELHYPCSAFFIPLNAINSGALAIWTKMMYNKWDWNIYSYVNQRNYCKLFQFTKFGMLFRSHGIFFFRYSQNILIDHRTKSWNQNLLEFEFELYRILKYLSFISLNRADKIEWLSERMRQSTKAAKDAEHKMLYHQFYFHRLTNSEWNINNTLHFDAMNYSWFVWKENQKSYFRRKNRLCE